MNRDKPFRINQQERKERKEQVIRSIQVRREDCNKPKKGRTNE